MKKVFVVGAHGHVGKQMVEKLGKQGYATLAGVRNENQFDEYKDMENVEPTLFDLTSSPENMTTAFKRSGAQAIVFSAGSGGATGDDMTLSIDLDGAIKTMIAAKDAGIKRYVMVSAVGADNRAFWPNSGLPGYYVAKHYADAYLKNSGLDYTILRPTALTNNAETGKIILTSESDSQMDIPRADVANSVVEILGNDDTVNNIYEITSGDKNISDVLQ
ncbi:MULTISPECIES: SDR family oxidoreductase [Apilactobacillus]|uniref:SDR family oxidoreductase n=1 Tax=Apilactobacillus timberlakei TaxID=2008380 RepID=A0ABY2YVD2_9LACO|nr:MULTISPECIES: SDR family oxidoreductase [Apilactobacillus]TPR14790.1 SDR family oxidoreductase [Apilactobacillus timberlakei]TPR15757.1 SDR family oxidoreductase [Apilactobacillus timberlakei]TPR16118.1 SDR family oxidoreductase [Apilactobacillus timberlakei]TPR18190.1 SDR family oxidoreductase [Apilactobacillus timberlakei]TPR18865.1 SDR family oxidoreductase [Apilactobacillus timberlakei]